MRVFNKIGFHSSGERKSDVGKWRQGVAAAEVPFFAVVSDSDQELVQAQKLMQGTAVRHTLVFRLTGNELNAPDYSLEPEEAAAAHWQMHKEAFPVKLDTSLTWVETTSRLRPSPDRFDWLGQFAFHTGLLAVTDGFKWAAFGFAVAEPDAAFWQTGSVLRYLELCQEHPQQLGIALHEYSLLRDDIWFMRGDHVGRFQKLFDVCDLNGIERPPVFITEWGWTSQRMPPLKKGMTHIKEAAELYAQFPQVRGAAIFGQGGRRSGLARQAGGLLEPMLEFCQEMTFEIAEEDEFAPFVPPPMSADGGVAAMGEPAAQPNGRFIADVTIPDDTRMETGQAFTKTWRVKNTGNTSWEDYKLVHSDGSAMTNQKSISLLDIHPGQLGLISLELTAPNTPGTHFTDWRFQDDEGNFFGDILYARIVVERPLPTPIGENSVKFLKDVTVPDDTKIEPGAAFTKTWQVKNSGDQTWGSGFTLRFIGGTAMTAAESQPLPQAAKGTAVNISLELTAPKAPGIYHGDWRLFDDQEQPFGDTVFLRIVVPAPAGSTLVAPMSQRDPRWENKMLGHAGSPTTIGKWGCLLTCFAMTANVLGHETDSSRLNDAMLSRDGFLNGYFTKWNALTEVYADVVYEGKMDAHPNVTQFVDASLANGRPVTVLVDFTRDTPYSDNDQHWVLIVGKDGDDYRINDPWLLPAQEASLRARYGRAGQSLSQIIRSAILYRSTKQTIPTPDPKPDPVAPKRLQTGMNVNPDAPHSNPMDSHSLKGMDWVRFVFKLDARINEAERGHWDIAFTQYDNIVRKYNRQGTKSLIIINQETIWGIAPWTGNHNWQGYADDLAAAARKIADHFKSYGDQVAYQIWNEGDKKHNPASVYLEPEQFAVILKKVAGAITAVAPQSPIIFNGMATGPEESVSYLKRCQAALGGKLPVDAVGIHPYTRWATRAPFDWGNQYGTLGQAFEVLRKGLPGMQFWITEIGVADDNEIGSQFYAEIGDYLKDVYQHVAERYADLIPVVIWFAWSDLMRNAGIVDRNGNRKDHVYPAFRLVRNRELF